MSPLPLPDPRPRPRPRRPEPDRPGVEVLVDAARVERQGEEQVLFDRAGQEVGRLPDRAVLAWRLVTAEDR